MRKSLFFIISYLLLLITATDVFASSHPKAHFGEFGIQHFATLAQYQSEYVGKVVMYLPSIKASSCDDTEFSGQFKIPYKVVKIVGDDLRMKFVLKSLTDNTHASILINNHNAYYTYGKFTYCVTDEYSVPLLNLTKFDEVKESKIGKVINDNFEIIDIVMSEDLTGYNR